jgi:hypothetical protein
MFQPRAKSSIPSKPDPNPNIFHPSEVIHINHWLLHYLKQSQVQRFKHVRIKSQTYHKP